MSNYNLELGHTSFDPNREAQKMFLHVSSMAPSGCVDLASPIHLPPTIVLKPHVLFIGSKTVDHFIELVNKNFDIQKKFYCTNFVF